MPRISYDDLPLIPYLVAETVCQRPYSSEFSLKLTDLDEVERVERLRRKMSRRQIDAFCQKADDICRAAFETRADWFMKCVRSKTNAGRDQLYVWITHWLHSYLLNPSGFLSSFTTQAKRRRRS